jgi:chemotaxis protein MotB
MARKKAHEEHANHEAWAIPYGDLITLLLALFVVLYSMSSVNEGKYRVLSDSLNEAFGGKPRSARPIQVGANPPQGTNETPRVAPIMRRGMADPTRPVVETKPKVSGADIDPLRGLKDASAEGDKAAASGSRNLQQMAGDVEQAMHELIARKMIVVRRTEQYLEIEIRTDILFASGVARIADSAQPVLLHLADIVKPFPNPIRIEGHTDNVPINTLAFPSNWQLSASRAASVVALFMQSGVDPTRMSVAGFGEYHPAASNDTVEGRNRNRRVLIVILADQNPAASTAIGDALATDATASAGGSTEAMSSAPDAAPASATETAMQPLQPVSATVPFRADRPAAQ